MISDNLQVFSKSNIFQTCTEGKYHNDQVLVQTNSLVRMISGEMRIILPDTILVATAGDVLFLPRLELANVVKIEKDGRPYKSAGIYFSPEILKRYFSRNHLKPVNPQNKPGIHKLEPHPLLDSLFDSLLPYFKLETELPENIVERKIEEAISILKEVDRPSFISLGLFDEPGKINLPDFMEQNYMFNMTMEQFGYLTGRSLTTFKRDFKKAFFTTPQKWLTKKRLELAHQHLTEKKRKAVEVYMEVGFANLSHFSFAFKKHFGYAPTAVQEQVSRQV